MKATKSKKIFTAQHIQIKTNRVMKIKIVSIGKWKNNSLEKELYNKYYIRLPKNSVELFELDKQKTKRTEGQEILKVINKSDHVCCLDEHGTNMTTVELCSFIDIIEQQKTCCFVIGGADGIDQCVKDAAQNLISIGKMTLPHFLVRVILIEQIYRINQIKNGHPYHRE